MNGNSNSSIGGLALIAVVAIAAGLIGGVGGVLTVLAVALGVILLIVAAVMYFAFKGSAEDAASKTVKALDPADAAILSAARKELTELRVLNARIDSAEIRSLSNDICGTTEKMLKAMKEAPDRISAGQMFLQYYLPTQKSILTKFEQIENSGIDVTELREKVLNHLREIKDATDRQLANLFENDICDISAEMELMNYSCKEDGLL